jgi:precorrin-4/cobalt-precorrin-4 C11-methyltransferase
VELTAPEVVSNGHPNPNFRRTPLPEDQNSGSLPQLRLQSASFFGPQIENTVQTLVPYYGIDCPAAVIYHASWPDEKIIRGTLGDIVAKVKKTELGRTSIILVGRALSRDIAPSKLYDAGFRHGFRGGKKI